MQRVAPTLTARGEECEVTGSDGDTNARGCSGCSAVCRGGQAGACECARACTCREMVQIERSQGLLQTLRVRMV